MNHKGGTLNYTTTIQNIHRINHILRGETNPQRRKELTLEREKLNLSLKG